jgi:hypothetical protein
MKKNIKKFFIGPKKPLLAATAMRFSKTPSTTLCQNIYII